MYFSAERLYNTQPMKSSVYRFVQWLTAAGLALQLAAGCGAPPRIQLTSVADSTVIATAATGIQLTAGELLRAINQSQFLAAGGVLPLDSILSMRDSLLLDTLIGLRASEVSPESDYHIYRVYRKNYMERLIKEYWDQSIRRTLSVDSSEVLNLYRDSIHLFQVTERMLLRQILISPYGLLIGPDSTYYQALPGAVRDRDAEELALNLHRMLRFGESFYQVARRLSHDDQSRDNGGLIGWVGKGIYPHPFDSIAFTLPIESYSKPYRDRLGWHILKSEGYLPTGPAPIDSPQVWESVYLSALNVKFNMRSAGIMDSLIKSMQIVHNPLILDTTIYYVADSTWAAIVNGHDTIDAKDMKEVEEKYRSAFQVKNTTADHKREMTRELALPLLQAQAARAVGIDTLAAFREEAIRARRVSCRQIVEKASADPDYEPDTLLIDAYYRSHLDEFVVKNPISLEWLLVQDSAFCSFLQDQAETGREFADLVAEFSSAGTPVTIGKKLQVSDAELTPEENRAVLQTRRGGISRMFKSETGWQFIKLISIRDSKTLLQARGVIALKMMSEHRTQVYNAFRDDLFARYNVRFPALPAGDLMLENRSKRTLAKQQ